MHLARQQVADGRRLPAIGHVDHAGARHRLEQFAGKMAALPLPADHVDLFGTRLGVGDKPATVCAGNEGSTTITFGTVMMPATGGVAMKLKDSVS